MQARSSPPQFKCGVRRSQAKAFQGCYTAAAQYEAIQPIDLSCGPSLASTESLAETAEAPFTPTNRESVAAIRDRHLMAVVDHEGQEPEVTLRCKQELLPDLQILQVVTTFYTYRCRLRQILRVSNSIGAVIPWKFATFPPLS